MVQCNFCGESCGLGAGPSPSGDEVYSNGLLNQTVIGTYNSTPGNGAGALDDLDSYTFSLCEFCLDWLFCQFVVPPTVQEVSAWDHTALDDPHPFLPAAQRVELDEFRTHKDAFRVEAQRRAVLRLRAQR